MWNYFPMFGANAIFASTLRFVNVTILENTMEGAILGPRALPFIEYRREMSGVPEAYAAFIWEKDKTPDRDACLYIDYVK